MAYMIPRLITFILCASIALAVPAPSATAVRSHLGLWEFSTAVSPPGSRGCRSKGRFFISVNVNDGNPLDHGANAALLRGALDCTSETCVLDQWQTTLYPLQPFGPDAHVGNDNVMSRMPDGTILKFRTLSIILPTGEALGAGVWATMDCGNHWEFRSFLNPADTATFPPPELTDGSDPNASYAAPRSAPPGWDRPELYADPFHLGDVYATFLAIAGMDDKFRDILLARSQDGGRVWRSLVLGPAEQVLPPAMMTSNPGRIFFATCERMSPDMSRDFEVVLRWSDDRGQTIAGTFVLTEGLSSDFLCSPAIPGFFLEGSLTISRVRYVEQKHEDKTIARLDVVRITYPTQLSGRQAIRVFEVELRQSASPVARLMTTLADPAAHIIQLAVVEPDSSQISQSLMTKALGPKHIEVSLAAKLGTSLATWQVLPLSNAPIIFRGAYFNATSGQLEQQFDISQWDSHAKNGDYTKMAFFYNKGIACHDIHSTNTTQALMAASTGSVQRPAAGQPHVRQTGEPE